MCKIREKCWEDFPPVQVVPSERSVKSSWHHDAGDICSMDSAWRGGVGGGSSGRLIESRFPSHTSCNHSTVGSVWKRGKAGGQLLIFDFSGDACKKKRKRLKDTFFFTRRLLLFSFLEGQSARWRTNPIWTLSSSSSLVLKSSLRNV